MKTFRGIVRTGVIAALAAIIVVATRTVSHAQLATTVWPMLGHDIRHTGLSTVDTSGNPGQLKWVYDIVDQNSTSPVCLEGSPAIGADGTIYTNCDEFLYALNPDGTLKWKFQAGDVIEFSSPAIGADGTIYIGCFDHNLYAVTDNGANGTAKWTFATGGAVDSSPAIAADGTIYVGSSDNNLYAINPDGTQKWKFRTRKSSTGFSSGISSPAIGANGIIYVGSDEKLYAIADGGQGTVTKKWVFATGGPMYGSPTIGADGTVYVGSADGSLYAVTDEGSNFKKKWRFSTGGAVDSSPSIGADGTIYFASNDSKFYAITDHGTHATRKWAFAGGAVFGSALSIAADGTIFGSSENGNLYAITDNGTSATKKWMITVDGGLSSPVIAADGTIYVGGSGLDDLFAVGIPPAPVAVELGISTPSLDFGTLKPGDFATMYVTISNPIGSVAMPGLTVQMQGQQLSGYGDFTLTNLCGAPLQAGDNCQIGVTFAPSGKESETRTMMIFDNADNSPQIVNLNGAGG
jgi:outer membrane protein assembly factor BamB